MATTLSTESWWQDTFRVELEEIMDDLEPGWSTWLAGDAK